MLFSKKWQEEVFSDATHFPPIQGDCALPPKPNFTNIFPCQTSKKQCISKYPRYPRGQRKSNPRQVPVMSSAPPSTPAASLFGSEPAAAATSVGGGERKAPTDTSDSPSIQRSLQNKKHKSTLAALGTGANLTPVPAAITIEESNRIRESNGRLRAIDVLSRRHCKQ